MLESGYKPGSQAHVFNQDALLPLHRHINKTFRYLDITGLEEDNVFIKDQNVTILLLRHLQQIAFCPQFIVSWTQDGCHSGSITSTHNQIQVQEAKEWRGVKRDIVSLLLFFSRYKTLSPNIPCPLSAPPNPQSKCSLTFHYSGDMGYLVTLAARESGNASIY